MCNIPIIITAPYLFLIKIPIRAEPEINLPRSITISRVDPDIEIVEENITRRWLQVFTIIIAILILIIVILIIILITILITGTTRPAPAAPVMSRGRGLTASPGRGMRGTYSTRWLFKSIVITTLMISIFEIIDLINFIIKSLSLSNLSSNCRSSGRGSRGSYAPR